jgi:putative peptidoglycan lipid II flippase
VFQNEPERRAALAAAGGTLASRLLGVARDVLLAYLLGPGADVFLAAFRIPNLFRRLLAEGALGLGHLAVFAEAAARQGQEAALGLSRDLSRVLVLLSPPLLLLLGLAAPALVLLTAPGLAPDSARRAAFLLSCCLPYLPLCLLAGIALSRRACLGNLVPQALAPPVFNLCFLGAGLTALGLSSSPGASELFLCLGVSLAGAAQLALAGYPAAGGPAAFRRALARKEARSALARIPLAALGASAYQLQVLAGTCLASFLAGGSISALYFAERLLEFPLGLAGVSVGLLALPRLAERTSRQNREALIRGVSLSAFLSLPAAAGLAGLALPLSRLFFGQGAYSPEDARLTALCLAAYAPALPAMCADRTLLTALAALGGTRTVSLAAAPSLAASILAALPGAFFLGAPGIALGLTCGAWVHTALLLRALRQKGLDAGPAARRCLPYLPPALGMALLLFFLPLPLEDKGPLAASLAVMIAACALAWIGLFRLARNEDALALTALFLPRGPR